MKIFFKKTIPALILIFTLMLAGMPAFADNSARTAEAAHYTDTKGHWAEAAIEKYADTGIFADENGRFNPNRLITRSEFVMLLHKALDLKINYFKAPDISEFFSDVSNDAAYASQLYDLAAVGIIDRKGTFGAEEPLPREEMIHYIINALKYSVGDKYAVIKMMPAPFNDDPKITPAYKNDIIEAVLLKIVYGRGQNLLEPLKGSTRAEAAAVTGRMMDTIRKFNISIEVKPSAVVGESSIKLVLSVTNDSNEPVTINHSSGQKYDFALLDSNRNELYRWSSDKFFAMHLTSTVIEAGKTVEFSETLDGTEYTSIKDTIKYMKAYVVGKIDSYNFNPDGYEAEVE